MSNYALDNSDATVCDGCGLWRNAGLYPVIFAGDNKDDPVCEACWLRSERLMEKAHYDRVIMQRRAMYGGMVAQ